MADAALVTSGPTLLASHAGLAPRTSKATTVNSSLTGDPHVGTGQNVALMLVGGAGLIAGLLIGGGPGAVVAIAGAGVGLYGLYGFLK